MKNSPSKIALTVGFLLALSFTFSCTSGGDLKSESGWKSGGNGNDKYEFSALPGGLGFPGGGFYYVGYGFWWSASESGSYDAYHSGMVYASEGVGYNYSDKGTLFSVRCVQD